MLERPACLLCGNVSQAILLKPKNSPGPVVRCPECSFVYVSHCVNEEAIIQDGPVGISKDSTLRTSREIGDVNQSWEWPLIQSREREQKTFIMNHLNVLDRIRTYFPNPGRLLDFGCGGGFFLRTARSFLWEPFGLEPLPAHAVYARATTGAQVITDTLRSDSFPHEFFDLITAFQVFEHLPDPVGDLQKLAAFLKPGGGILIEVPNISNWSIRLFGSRHRHFVPDHLNFFSPTTLSCLLAKADLQPLEIYFPGRWLSLNHIVNYWGSRFLPSIWVEPFRKVIQKTGLAFMRVKLNFGDIVAIIGQKNAC